jgi:hypothetical protein
VIKRSRRKRKKRRRNRKRRKRRSRRRALRLNNGSRCSELLSSLSMSLKLVCPLMMQKERNSTNQSETSSRKSGTSRKRFILNGWLNSHRRKANNE